MKISVRDDKIVVSEDATVQSVPTEETVKEDMAVDLGTAEELPIEVPQSLVDTVIEKVEIPILVIEEERFVLKLGDDLWFQSWKPYVTCTNKSDAMILDADWARGYSSSIKMMKHINSEIIKL